MTNSTRSTTGNGIPSHKGHFVYIVRCADGTLYTGYTTEVERRLAEHNAGTGAKYTRGRGPVELVYVEEGADRSWGLVREREIKRMSRSQKEHLIRHGPTARAKEPIQEGFDDERAAQF